MHSPTNPPTNAHGPAPVAASPPSADTLATSAAHRSVNRKVDQLLRRTLSNSSSSRANTNTSTYRPLHPVPVALPALTRPSTAAGYRHVPARGSSPLSPAAAALITSPDSVTSPLTSPRSPYYGQPSWAGPGARCSAASPISPKAFGQLRRLSLVHGGSPQRTVISEASPAVSLIGSIAAASTLEVGQGRVQVARARSGPAVMKRVSHGVADGSARRVRGYAMRWWWKQRAFNSPGFPLVLGLSAFVAMCTFISSTTTTAIDHSPATPECTMSRIYLILSACLSAATLLTSLAAYSLHRQHQSWWLSHALSQLVSATSNVFSPKTLPAPTLEPPNSPSTLSSFATSLPASIAPTPPPSPAPETEPPKGVWVVLVTWLLAIVRVLRLLSIGLGIAAVVLVARQRTCGSLLVGAAVNLALVAVHALAWIGLFAATFIDLPWAMHMQSKLAQSQPGASHVQSKLHFVLAPWAKHTPLDDPHIVQYHRPADAASGNQHSWASQVDSASTTCPICLGKFSAGDTLARVPTHAAAAADGATFFNVYHAECLHAWPHVDECPECGLACPTSSTSPEAAPAAAHTTCADQQTLAAGGVGAALQRHASTKSKRSAVFIRDYWLGVAPSAAAAATAAAREGYALAEPRPSTDAEAWAAHVLGVATQMEGWTWTPGASREGSVEVEREWEEEGESRIEG